MAKALHLPPHHQKSNIRSGGPMEEHAFRREVDLQLEQALLGVGGLKDYLRVVVSLAAEAIAVDGSYSLSTTVGGRLTSVATTDPDPGKADAIGFDLASGPATDPLRGAGRLHLDDLHRDDRSRDGQALGWTAAAVASGFRSAAGAVAWFGPGDHSLALNAYSRTVAAFAGAPLDRAGLFLTEVARTMPRALRIFDQQAAIRDLQAALVSRSVIDKALGVVMARRACSSEAAFDHLRRTSQNSNIKLRTLADQILEGYPGAAASPPIALRSA